VACSSAANSPHTATAARPAPAQTAATRRSTPGVVGVSETGKGRVPAGGGQGLLGEVVGADAQEVDVWGERGGLGCGGGYLDHDPDLQPGWVAPSLPGDGGVEHPRAAVSSARVLIIGNISRIGVSWAARTMASSW